MFKLGVSLRSIYILLFVILTVACAPQKDKSANSGKNQFILSSVSEETSDCALKIRNMMESKAIKLTPLKEIKNEVDQANNVLNKGEAALEYEALKKKGEIIQINVVHVRRTSGSLEKVTYSLEKADSDTEALLSLSLEVEVIRQGYSFSIEESLLVDKTCNPRSVQTSIDKIEKERPLHYKYTSFEMYVDGGKEEETKTFSVKPEQEPLANFFVDDDFNLFPQKTFSYSPDEGIMVVQIGSAQSGVRDGFNKKIDLQMRKITYFYDKENSIELLYGENKKDNIKLFELLGTETWTIPRSIWVDLSLGSSEDLNSYFDNLLTAKDLESSGKFVFVSSFKPAYDHFSAYFNIQKISYNEETKLYSLTVEEKSNPVIRAPTKPTDLESNDTIQTHHPEIQKVAKQILAQEPSDRVKQVQLILDYLKSDYKYDHDMIKNNIVRSLTTEQALEKRKGVCQHYAVIFVSISRAIGIPSRIIGGYHLGDKTAGAHAWVEAEVEKGLWRVMEPQDPHTMQNMKTRYYIPTDHARYLEDKNVNFFATVLHTMTANYSVKPVDNN